MRKSMIVVTVAVLALMISGAAMAQRADRPARRGMQDLDLDEAQLERLETLRMEHRLAMVDLQAAERKLRLTMQKELRADDPDRAELERIAGQVAGVREKSIKRRLKHLFAVREVVNEDQWKQFLRRRNDRWGFGEMGELHSHMRDVCGRLGRRVHRESGPARSHRRGPGGGHGHRRAGAGFGRLKI